MKKWLNPGKHRLYVIASQVSPQISQLSPQNSQSIQFNNIPYRDKFEIIKNMCHFRNSGFIAKKYDKNCYVRLALSPKRASPVLLPSPRCLRGWERDRQRLGGMQPPAHHNCPSVPPGSGKNNRDIICETTSPVGESNRTKLAV